MSRSAKWFRLGKKLQTLRVLAAAAMVAGCGESFGPQTAHIKIQLTDAPADEIAMAEVWISRIYLQGGGDDSDTTSVPADSTSDDSVGGRLDLYNDPDNPLYFDLLTLRDSVTADLTGFEEITSGLYQGLRFVVDSARVTLVEGLTFPDGGNVAPMRTPSAQKSGIKVNLNRFIDSAEGDSTTVLVDFDVDASFLVQRNGPNQQIRQVIFKPVLKELARTEM